MKKLCEVHIRGGMYTKLLYTYRCKHLYIYIYIKTCVNVLFFSQQASTSSIAPTREQAYIKTHTRKDESYPNELTRKRCVCYSTFIFISYVFDNLLTRNICLMH
jgi:hypothetical protein